MSRPTIIYEALQSYTLGSTPEILQYNKPERIENQNMSPEESSVCSVDMLAPVCCRSVTFCTEPGPNSTTAPHTKYNVHSIRTTWRREHLYIRRAKHLQLSVWLVSRSVCSILHLYRINGVDFQTGLVCVWVANEP